MSSLDIQHVVDLVVEVACPEQIILFGSHARGEASEHSDVDLLVVLPTGADRRIIGQQVRAEMMRRRVRTPVDMLFRTRDQVEYRRRQFAHLMWIIDREGLEVYAVA